MMLLLLEWLLHLEMHLEIRGKILPTLWRHFHPARLAVSYATETVAVVQL